MIKYLISILRPPTFAEAKSLWREILIGAAFVLIVVILDSSDDEESSIVWVLVEIIFAYLITFLAVIGNRIEKSEKEK